MLNVNDKVQSIDKFLKFAYCFPIDLKTRMLEHFGHSLGTHFYSKFQYFTDKHGNNFVGLIYMFSDMTTNNQVKFVELMEDYYKEVV